MAEDNNCAVGPDCNSRAQLLPTATHKVRPSPGNSPTQTAWRSPHITQTAQRSPRITQACVLRMPCAIKSRMSGTCTRPNGRLDWLNLDATQVLGRQNHAPHAVRGDSGTQHAKQSCMTGGLRQQTVAGAAKNAIPGAKTKGKKKLVFQEAMPAPAWAGRAPNPKQFRGATFMYRNVHSAPAPFSPTSGGAAAPLPPLHRLEEASRCSAHCSLDAAPLPLHLAF